jgi:hypothetical protein
MMAEDRVTIDTASVFDNTADRQVEFAGEASGERYAFALRYDVLEALAGDATFDAMPLFQRHRARSRSGAGGDQRERSRMSGIDWRMSAVLANVDRGGSELAEVTSLEQTVQAWLALDNGLQNEAVLRPERAVVIDGETVAAFEGQAIRALADRLP